MIIDKIFANKIFDSRGQQTIEVSVNDCKASSPSGKSTGKYETDSYRISLDWNIKAINLLNINFEINKFEDLNKLERLIKNKFKLRDVKQFGANALFALESGILKALAKSQKKELWQIVSNELNNVNISIPLGNIIGGGMHSHIKNHPDFQEFLIIPKGKSAKENFKIMTELHKKVGKIINSKKINDEGAWETSLDEEEIFQLLFKFYKKVSIGVDVASSSFYKEKYYYYKNKLLSDSMQEHYINYLIKKYNLFYVEDPLQEEDFKGFSKIIKNSLIVGDDLTATQIKRVEKSIRKKSINALIIKPNQNGSLVELSKIFKICKKNKIKTIISHRSGETMDSALADYAVGFGADYIKCGIATKWREVKLKRLVEIENSFK